MQIKVKIEGVKVLVDRLKNIRRNITPMTIQTLEANGRSLQSAVLVQFQREGIPRWASLSWRYRQWKEKMGFDPRILSRTHLLQQLVYWRRNSGLTGQISGEVTIPEGVMYPEPVRRGTGIRSHREARKYSRRKSYHVLNSKAPVSVWKIAEWLDQGTGRMPARPIWAPVVARKHRQVLASFEKMLKSLVP